MSNSEIIDATDDGSGGNVRIVFSTTETDAALHLPEDSCQLYVPVETKRYGLSRILNSESMLATTTPVPFDFLVNGDFIRGSLGDYLSANRLSANETTVDVVYVRALVPPTYDTSFEHPDWVSSVDVLSETSPSAQWGMAKGRGGSLPGRGERVLSASFDGLLRVWNSEGDCVATSPGAADGGHRMAIKAARYLSPTHVASGGIDRTVKVWRYSEDTSAGTPIGTFKHSMDLRGHSSPITTLEVHGATSRILTADSGGSVALWTSSKESAPLAPSEEDTTVNGTAKRRKVSTTSTAATRGALHMSKQHAGAAVATFDSRDPTVGYSGGGTDHAVRTLDLATSRDVSSVTLTADITSILSLRGAMAPVIAAGTAGRRIVLIDPREGGSARTSILTLKGHTNWVSSLAQGPPASTNGSENSGGDYNLASASHDGSIMVWDLRAAGSRDPTAAAGSSEDSGPVARPVYIIDREQVRGKKRPVAGEGIKVFDLKWDASWGIVSGSEDRKVQVDRWK